MIIKRGDAQILNIIPEEELEEVQKVATKEIAKNIVKNKPISANTVKEEKKN